jgi:hypothetical protein
VNTEEAPIEAKRPAATLNAGNDEAKIGANAIALMAKGPAVLCIVAGSCYFISIQIIIMADGGRNGVF